MKQADIEEAIYHDAIRRQAKAREVAIEHGQLNADPSAHLIYRSLEDVYTRAVEKYLNDAKAGKARRMADTAHLLIRTQLPTPMIAHHSLKTALGFILAMVGGPRNQTTKAAVSIAVANAVHNEWRLQELARLEPKLVKQLDKDFKSRSYGEQLRVDTFRQYAEKLDTEWQQWSQADKAKVGMVLLHLLADCTDLFTISPTTSKIILSDALPDVLHKLDERTLLDLVFRLPCVDNPLPWSSSENLFMGAYYNPAYVGTYPIIKGARNRDKKRMQAMNWSNVLPAVNVIQETRWCINNQMLDLISWVHDVYTVNRGEDVGSLAQGDRPPLPVYPVGADEETLKEHAKQYFIAKQAETKWKSRAIAAKMTIAMARKYRNVSFCFPHDLDTRGRMYPVVSFLSPQGTDYQAALLEFERPMQITPENRGGFWLAIAVANTYGYDKVSLSEREQWVFANQDWIVACGKDPQKNLQWMQADEPFRFVRACMEWARYVAEGCTTMWSHMPVHVDATCSGLQHYAALMRSVRGGRSVNLLPSSTRHDIYGEVADEAIALLKTDGTAEALNLVAFGIDRKITKRQTMVVPYAATFHACMSYTREAVAEKLSNGARAGWDVNDPEVHNAHLLLLSKCIWAAIDNVVVEGKEAMRWLSAFGREYANAVNKTDGDAYSKAMTFKTYDGFEVLQHRPRQQMRRIESLIDGKRVRMQIYDIDGPDRSAGQQSPSDMATSLPPNFIHALDAAHLRMSVLYAIEQGVTNSFSMVHDSFGVHAAAMDAFSRDCIRPAFVKMYTEYDPLEALYVKYKHMLPADFPAPPTKGDLDIYGVLESEYFFS